MCRRCRKTLQVKYELKKVFKLSEMPKEIQHRYDYNITEATFETVLLPLFPTNSSKSNIDRYNQRMLLINYLVQNGADLNEEVIIDLYS